MKSDKQSRGLDVKAFAQSGGVREQEGLLADFPRLSQEAEGRAPDTPVRWRAVGEQREGGGVAQAWLHLTAETQLPVTCQRCLEPVALPLSVDRWFRFVADEATAEREDEEAEEDVLVLDPAFDLPSLVEDELLMELPLVPRHAVCPTTVALEHADPDFEEAKEAKPNPFGVLAGMKLKPGKDEH
ncbi:DUF177 domain-containing protein [Pseudorhodoferax sp. Leaf267]|uniref:YceD family protein n=1 Tax=Pseudorhodoferax sp. Leaf267 TaxID=1736316 RepID=UPI0006FEC6A4|nr:YceD family protein [Pseudorhodoferax sp. Leaf267]KQP14301.1 hypothetical protein ASF43_15910 [Pseudorhodoferax sp. Leaf267]